MSVVDVVVWKCLGDLWMYTEEEKEVFGMNEVDAKKSVIVYGRSIIGLFCVSVK